MLVTKLPSSHLTRPSVEKLKILYTLFNNASTSSKAAAMLLVGKGYGLQSSRSYLANVLATFCSPRFTAYVRKHRKLWTLLVTTRLQVMDILKVTSLKPNLTGSAGRHTFSPRQVQHLLPTLIHLLPPLEGNIPQIVPGQRPLLSPICQWNIHPCLHLLLEAQHPIIYPITFTPCSYRTSRISQHVAMCRLSLPYPTPPRTLNHRHLLEVDPFQLPLPSHPDSNHNTHSPQYVGVTSTT